MGVSCSSASSAIPAPIHDDMKADPQKAEVVDALNRMIPNMLHFLVTGKDTDYDKDVAPNCVDKDVLFVVDKGHTGTGDQIVNNYQFTKAEMSKVNSLRVFAGDKAAVATITISCTYAYPTGVYEIVRNSFLMRGPEIDSKRLDDIDGGDKIEVEKVVAVRTRLRGKVKGQEAWITLDNKDDDTIFVKLLKSTQSYTAEEFTYTVILEKIPEERDEDAWKLVHCTISEGNKLGTPK